MNLLLDAMSLLYRNRSQVIIGRFQTRDTLAYQTLYITYLAVEIRGNATHILNAFLLIYDHDAVVLPKWGEILRSLQTATQNHLL